MAVESDEAARIDIGRPSLFAQSPLMAVAVSVTTAEPIARSPRPMFSVRMPRMCGDPLNGAVIVAVAVSWLVSPCSTLPVTVARMAATLPEPSAMAALMVFS